MSLVTSTVQSTIDVLHSDPMNKFMGQLHKLFAAVGIPRPYIGAGELAVAVLSGCSTLGLYYVLRGRRSRKTKHDLRVKLARAQTEMEELEIALADLNENEAKAEARSGTKKKKQIRIWMDGAFDMSHYGHMNAFRQGRALGDYLIVGINSDSSIRACKGTSPILTDSERVASVAGCKFVDEVVPECPYVMNAEYLRDVVFGQYQADYVVHGDDPCLDVHGNDVYGETKKMGKYRSIPRTEGVSTTDIVGRMLICSRDHHQDSTPQKSTQTLRLSRTSDQRSQLENATQQRRNRFLTTNRILRAFSSSHRAPKPTDKIVYMDGAFDMFHAGHVGSLRAGKALGDYLIVGIHNDTSINLQRGSNMPIMNLQERVLSVLGCKYVDDVVIDAPWEIDEQMIKSLNISIIAHGSHDDNSSKFTEALYKVPKKLSMFREIQSTSKLSVGEIVNRVQNESSMMARIAKKKAAEAEYYKQRFDLADDEKKAE